MTLSATTEPEEFEEAVDWFGRRWPITDELEATLSDYAQARAWKIAGVTQLDVVTYVHDSLKRAVRDGTHFNDWKRDVAGKLTEQWGRSNSSRLETIFVNATHQAYNAGRWRQMTDPDVVKHRAFGLFDAILDSHTSDVCKECDGTCLPLDDPWFSSHSPQLHHRCRSQIRSITERQALQRGITADPAKTGADNGFGALATDSQWEPNASDYPTELWSSFEKKADELT